MKIIEMNKLWVKNKLKEIVHNNLVHGIMSFLPRHISEKIHDKNAECQKGVSGI